MDTRRLGHDAPAVGLLEAAVLALLLGFLVFTHPILVLDDVISFKLGHRHAALLHATGQDPWDF